MNYGGPPAGMMPAGMFGPAGALADSMEANKNPLHMCYKLCENPNELNEHNILELFSKCPSQFYDRQCDNEVLVMQRQPMSQLGNMTGIQYHLVLANKPLFVIRKVKRNSPNEVSPLAEYYVINGVIYQSPDLASVVNSRLTHALFHMREAFEKSYSYVKYNPSKGYSWNFAGPSGTSDDSESTEEKPRSSTPPNQVRSTLYQRTRVDDLLALLTKEFPPPEQNGVDEKPPEVGEQDARGSPTQIGAQRRSSPGLDQSEQQQQQQHDDAHSTASDTRSNGAEPSAKRSKHD